MPFAVAGVLLVLGSVVIGSGIAGVHRDATLVPLQRADAQRLADALAAARPELERALVVAGLLAYDYVGERPVVAFGSRPPVPELWAHAAQTAGLEDPDLASPEVLWRYNQARAKEYLWQRLEATLRDTFAPGRFEHRGISIAVEPEGIQGTGFARVTFTDIARPVRRDAGALSALVEAGRAREDASACGGVEGQGHCYRTYTVASLDVPLAVTDLRSGERSRLVMRLEAPIPSRLPLLWELGADFEASLGTQGRLGPSRFALATTGIGLVLTEAHSLFQYAHPGFADVVTNRWLAFAVNAALQAETYAVFQTTDAVALGALLLHAGDAAPRLPGLDAPDAGSRLEDLRLDEVRDLDTVLDGGTSPGRQEFAAHQDPQALRRSLAAFAAQRFFPSVTFTCSFDDRPPEPCSGSQARTHGASGHLVNLTVDVDQPALRDETLALAPGLPLDSAMAEAYEGEFQVEVARGAQEVSRNRPRSDYRLASSSGWSCRSGDAAAPVAAGEEAGGTGIIRWSRTETWRNATRSVSVTATMTEQVTFSSTLAAQPPGLVNAPLPQAASWTSGLGVPGFEDGNLRRQLLDYAGAAHDQLADLVCAASDTARTAYPSGWRGLEASRGGGAPERVALESSLRALAREVVRTIATDDALLAVDLTSVYDSEARGAASTATAVLQAVQRVYEAQHYELRALPPPAASVYQRDASWTSAGAKSLRGAYEVLVRDVAQGLAEAVQVEGATRDRLRQELERLEGAPSVERLDEPVAGLGDVLAALRVGGELHLTWPATAGVLEEEPVRVGVMQHPAYLVPSEGPPAMTLGNVAVFLSAGLPLLPPQFPWLATMNLWLVHVSGRVDLRIEDSGGESLPDPLWGHRAQALNRANATVASEDCARLPPRLCNEPGLNVGFGFDFNTAFVGVVPPGRRLGDAQVCELEPKPGSAPGAPGSADSFPDVLEGLCELL